MGFGGAGQAHSFYLSCVAGCRVAKIFDPKPGAAARAAARAPEAAFCGDLDTFWPDLDAVIVCTPDSTHADYIIQALAHGLHVLVEKPLTDSHESLRAIRRAARAAAGQMVAVVHQMRFVPLHRRIKSLIDAGTLGALSYLEGYYVHDLTERAFANDRWRETDNATPLVYSGCHFVDLLRWFAGEEIVEVFAAAGHRAFPAYPESDLNVVTLRFASGAIGAVTVAFGEPGPQDHTVRVAGTAATVRNNLLYRRDGALGEVLHRPMLFQPAHAQRSRQERRAVAIPAAADQPPALHLRTRHRGAASARAPAERGVRRRAVSGPSVRALARLRERDRRLRRRGAEPPPAALLHRRGGPRGARLSRRRRVVPHEPSGCRVGARIMKPRVLHAVDELGRRSETFVYTVLTHHREFDASVLCQSHANTVEFPFPGVHVLPQPRSRKALDWWVAESIARATGRAPWRRRVEALIERLTPDVVHAHFGPVGCGLIPITHDMGVPLVTSLYGVDAAVLPYLPQWRDLYARLFRDGDRFLAEGPEMRKKIIAAGADASRTALQPIAIDLARYPRWTPDDGADGRVRRTLRPEERAPRRDRGVCARARSRARRAVHHHRRRARRDAGPRESGRARASAEAVDFVGMKPHADVIATLRTARALIHPSATADDGDSEGGAPTILLEAQAIGTPIVATRHADIPNVVPEGPGVRLCAEHDVIALGDALVAVLEARRPSGREHVAAHHGVETAIASLEDRYREVIAAHAPARVGAR